MSEIKIWNRKSNQEEIEKVYGESAIRFLYENPVGQNVFSRILTGSLVSQGYGCLQGTSLSRKKINPFIKNFNIPMDQYLGTVEDGTFKSFNDFFIRKFRDGKREFDQNPNSLPAFSEGRYFGWESIKEDQIFPVKGKYLMPLGLLKNGEWAEKFVGGPLLISRLCPVDYHRFHFPDDGETASHYRVPGKLHSVNPVALQFKSDIFVTNERQVSILKTKNFGHLAYIEVGATMVGKIVQTHPVNTEFKRGDEKGYFLFGGSTVILLGEKGKWTPSPDILENTAQQREVLIQLGDSVGQA